MGEKMKRVFFWLFFLLFILSVGFFGYFFHQVSQETALRIEKGAIDRVIASESPVYYQDGQTPIGVFFEKTHSKYIAYEEIPKVFVKALIASEDSNFFHHFGFDPKALLRAFTANIRSGRIVQGGSTITQQTAKNVFMREKRSYAAKLKELIQAVLLERRYSKEEILEMYANQFFVTGYGKGLRIAAQYYFDKDPEELDLVEAAFIVGSLNGPNLHNPFLKKSEEDKAEAAMSAKARKNYVLSRMLTQNFITGKEYEEAVDREVPFKKGSITFRLNVIMDYVREQLESDYFKKILQEQGVDNIATSGIRIITSVDRPIQEAALLSLRNKLQSIAIRLEGYQTLQETDERAGFLAKMPADTQDGLPFLAKIEEVKTDREDAGLLVSWEQGEGWIAYDGLKPVAEAWLKGRIGSGAVLEREHLPLFLNLFKKGDFVPVRLNAEKGADAQTEKPALLLSALPALEGGIVVLKEGMVKAMAGGFFNRFFNRTVDAKRQLGSIFKPLVYAAALQLKWNILDPLPNRRDLFRFEDTFYLPNPDHEPRSDAVSMAWAGAQSENLATVWLLYHLTDHLNMAEFRWVANLVGLGEKEGETYEAYQERIRDQYGVVVNHRAMREGAFEEAKEQIRSDIIFAGYEDIIGSLGQIRFDLPVNVLSENKPDDLRIKMQDFQRLKVLNREMKRKAAETANILGQLAHTDGGAEAPVRISDALENFYSGTDGNGLKRLLIYTDSPQYAGAHSVVPITSDTAVSEMPFFSDPGGIRIDGWLPSTIIDLLERATERNFAEMGEHKRYSFETLARIRNFRTLVNLSFVVYLSKKLGIKTELDPVLSFPLGPNAISILEAALAYQTLLTGLRFPSPAGMKENAVPIIQKIADREGNLLWEYVPAPEKVISDRVAVQVSEILRNVMENGTGKSAEDAVKVFDIRVPSFGKTGTANNYTNSSFVGLVPTYDKKGGQMNMKEGYVIAGYVGYDDNRPMKGKHLTVYGASGALPLWVDTAKAIVASPDYTEGLQPADLIFSQMTLPEEAKRDFRKTTVSPLTGLPLHPSVEKNRRSTQHPEVLAPMQEKGGEWKLMRYFEPIADQGYSHQPGQSVGSKQ